MPRAILFVTTFVLAILTILTHVAQLLEATFNLYAAAVLIALVLSTFVAIVWFWKYGTPSSTSWVPELLVLLTGVVCAILVVAVETPPSDDFSYVPNALYYVEHPDQPFNFDVHFFYSAAQPIQSISWATSLPHEYIQAALSLHLPIRLLDFYYVLVPALFGFLLPLALYYLTIQFVDGALYAALGVVLGIGVLLFLGENGRTPLLFTFENFRMGKDVCVGLGVPLLAAQTLRFFKASSVSVLEWVFLFAIGTMLVGLSSTSIVIISPLCAILLVALFFTISNRRRFARRALAYLASMGYVLFYALFHVLNRSQVPDYFSAMNASFPADFWTTLQGLINPVLPLTPITALLAALAAVLVLRGERRRFLILWIAAAVVLVLNPLSAQLLIRYVTTQNTYWRLFYLIPIPFLVSVAAGQGLFRLHQRSPRLAYIGLGVALALVAIAHLQLESSLFKQPGVWFLSGNADDPARVTSLWDLDERSVTTVQAIIAATPPGVMFAPIGIANNLLMFSSLYPQLRHREEARFWIGERQNNPLDSDHRERGSDYLDKGEVENFAAFTAILMDYQPVLTSIVCRTRVCREEIVQSVLLDHGFSVLETIDAFTIYVSDTS